MIRKYNELDLCVDMVLIFFIIYYYTSNKVWVSIVLLVIFLVYKIVVYIKYINKLIMSSDLKNGKEER